MTNSNTEKKFDLLYQTMEKYNQRFITAVITTASILIIIIGWVLTDVVVQNFFKNSNIATLAYLCLIPLQIYGYVVPLNRVFLVNQRSYKQIKVLDYIEPEYYNHHKLPESYRWMGIILNVINYLILGILVSNAHWQYL